MLYAVIPAGGSGTRLWPLSRADHPKFLLTLAGSPRSLLQETVARLRPLVPVARTLIVTGQPHVAAVAGQLPDVPSANLLAEPSPKDSGGAIGLAAAVIARRDPAAIMGSFAADHVVRDSARFTATVQEAVRGAEAGWLMTVGMRPTRPETGFGYVQHDSPAEAGPIRPVRQFKEKPDHETAVEFLRSGDYLWNASMFIWRVDVFLAALARHQPELHELLLQIAADWDTPRRAETLHRLWPRLPRIAVEYAVMEEAAAEGLVATVPGDFGWSDVGDFRNLTELMPADDDGNVVLADPLAEPAGASPPALLLDSQDTVVVPRGGRLVSVLGLKDVIVVDTPDALLVCARDRAQEVKRFVDQLKERGDTARQ
ncbi:mannose-1-phosphate guanylyltransferase [Natronosporangium hydrolyticum]|uniref:Mannose-1-phosphate guanylyltransferase n=1 Tax=Natronosporangium hydrolyticum TaxID=2811111 RepID=A0A895Y9C1_9ACTN|nr:mannose-1-phosphate guanylyltransferase [Natronosporangium hydrolyticum]QSB13911.1 mannose-1-phosphate guanylyltransferase [Natronosporangium hydrolyticum]